MDDLDRYIANAGRAHRLAMSMADETHRGELLLMAAEWRRLADEAAARLSEPDPPQP